MDKNLQGEEQLRALKSRAKDIQAAAKAAGSSVKHSAALEAVAHEQGFRDWNAAVAAANGPPEALEALITDLWRDIERALPRLPRSRSEEVSDFYAAIRRLMRWANDCERLAKTGDEHLRDMLHRSVADQLPYVFVRDQTQWGDDLFRLCDRSYSDGSWPGIVFTHEELVAAGVVDWEAEFGEHGGLTMYSVILEGMLDARDPDVLRRAARLLAGCALVADNAYVRQLGVVMPERTGFTIDLADSKQFTRKAVARLIGCRDDSRHRQLRVTTAGIAFLSDTIGNQRLEGLTFRMEVWGQGNGYVGLAASQDEAWVEEVFKDLRDNWPKPKARLVDW